MGMLDDMKTKAKGLVTDNKDKIESGLDKAGAMVNKKTGGKHADKIDKGLGKVSEGLDKVSGEPKDAAPPAPTPPPTATGPVEPPQPTTPPLV